MKPAVFDYARAGSVAEAVAMLAAADTVRAIAGGQSLGPMLNLRLARPSKLIDIKRIPELRAIAADGRVLRIGACRTHAEIEDGVVEDVTQGMLATVARGISYRAVRNRGTLGGSLAHADPAADWVSAMVALGAVFIVQGPGVSGASRPIGSCWAPTPRICGKAKSSSLSNCRGSALVHDGAITKSAARPASSPARSAPRCWTVRPVLPVSSVGRWTDRPCCCRKPPGGWTRPARRRRRR